jgi:hypothetical protein
MPRSIDTFSATIDYHEALAGAAKGPVFFGHRASLAHYYADIDAQDTASMYHGRVLYSEHATRPDGKNWTYEKNQAFWAGIIKTNQRLILVSDINDYRQAGGGTVDELFWLQDNGYIFLPDPSNPIHTLAEPPAIPFTKSAH